MSEKRIKRLDYNDGTSKYVIEIVGYYSDGQGFSYSFNNKKYDTFDDAFKVAFPNKNIEDAKYVVNEEIVFCEYNIKEEE